MKYFLLGAIPPPLGGVAIYCMRKIELLKKDGHDVYFFDSRYKLNLVKLILFSYLFKLKGVEHEIEINVSNPLVILLLTFTGLSKRCVFFDHNSSRRLLSNKLNSFIFGLFCRNVKSIKTVNDDLVKNYPGILKGKLISISVHSPFLEPTKDEINIGRNMYPERLQYLLGDGIRDIVLASAWKPISTASEVDLYGIKDTLAIYRHLLDQYPQIKFVLMIGVLDDSSFSNEIKSLIEELEISNNFEFIVGGFSQLPLLKRTLVLLRLTKTDGDSVSVREALHLGASVIATDVSNRPNSVKLVPVNNLNKTQETLELIINQGEK